MRILQDGSSGYKVYPYPDDTSKVDFMIKLSPQIYVYESGEMHFAQGTNELCLEQIPSAAFGDGSHPTTRLCAGAVDSLCRSQSPLAVLDVGTGNGVLARIARARFVPFVAGTDIDEESLVAARRNATLDDNSSPIHFENSLPDHWGPRFGLVVANILEAPIRELSKALVASLCTEGQLLLSGFTRAQSPGLCILYKSLGLKVLSESESKGWAMLHLQLAN